MNFIIRSVFIVIVLGIVTMISLAVVKETYRRHQIQKEIEDLRSQANNKERENQKLKGLIEYFKTSDFQEKEAKENLNVQKEGEQVLLVKGNRQKENDIIPDLANKPAPQEDQRSNSKKWWDYFFASRS